MNAACKWLGHLPSTGHNLVVTQCDTTSVIECAGTERTGAGHVIASARFNLAPLGPSQFFTTKKEVSMHIRTLLAAMFGLAFLAPAGSPAFSAPRDVAAPFLLAQATQTDEEKAKEELEKLQKSKRPGRDDAKDRGAAKSPPAKDAAEKSAPARARDEPKDAPARKDAPPAQTRDEQPRRDQDRARGGEKAKQDAARKSESDTKSKAAAEEKAKDQPVQPTQQPVQRTQEPSQRTTEPAQRTQEPARERQQTQDRDRRGPSGDRARRGDDEQRSRERASKRESEKTSAQELSKTELRGDKTMTIDGGSRTLRREGNRVVIRSNDFDRLRGSRGDQRVERLPNGQTRTIVVYPDGAQIITVIGSRGEIVRRSRRDRGGREIILIREVNRAPMAQINLGPLRLSIPREQYIVDGRRASRGDLRAALIAPPVEPVERMYSLEEVRQFDRIRDKMRRIDIDITFDTDSALITPDQAGALEELAAIINDMIDRNPGETFLIEGHTDLVGSDIYNLALSDRRAEAVAIALTDYFDVPPENLVTQGYGEAFPKIPTEQAERENRRTAFRRISPLVAGQN
jgi:outer membrane protein OmpA-like peptidoglycan-associated protein